MSYYENSTLELYIMCDTNLSQPVAFYIIILELNHPINHK